MKNIFRVSAMLSLVYAVSLFGADVKSDYDRNMDLSKLHSFRFADQSKRAATDALSRDQIVDKRLRNALRANLNLHSLKESELAPDFTVAYYAAVARRAQVTTGGYGLPRFGPGNVRVDQRLEGTVIVDFINAATDELIWRGYVTGALDPNNSEARTNESIKKLIERFSKDRKKQLEMKK